jgi:hypothetical protein
MQLSGAFYPRLMRMACFQIQVDLGCDPSVLKYFSDRMILQKVLLDEPIHIFTMDAEEWKNTEEKWSRAESLERETSPLLH